MLSDDSRYIHDLISEGEHQQLDFKFEISNAKKIAKTLSAFANTDGGRLLIGVKDNGKVSGILTEEEYYMIESAAIFYSKPEIKFESIKRIVGSKVVLEIVIKASDKKPHYAKNEDDKWLAYHRVNDNNFLADYILLQVWKREKRELGTFIRYSEKEEAILQFLERENKVRLKDLMKIFSLKRREIQNILINLVSLEAIKMEFIDNETYFSIEEDSI